MKKIFKKIILCLVLIVLSYISVSSKIINANAQSSQISNKALEHIKNLASEKASRTKSQRKISSRLLYAAKMRKGISIASGVHDLRTGVEIDSTGNTLIDIKTDVDDAVINTIEKLGGTLINSFPEYRAMRVRIPFNKIEDLAALSQISNIQPADKYFTNKVNTSEGDVAHRADLARLDFGVDGTGITIGVLSDGVDSLADIQASGDLPANVVPLSGQEGSGDEGTAMLEIVYDLAPGAELRFATAMGGQSQFAANIQALRTAGADVIVDDVGYFAEPVFQDGIIAQAINTVTADGALYFSSAGNSGNLNDGTSGVWEGDFIDIGTDPFGLGLPTHEFTGGRSSNQITDDPPFYITLKWSDPSGGSGNDYDLYLFNSDLTEIVATSGDYQNGDDEPFEIISSLGYDDTDNRLVIVKYSGDDRFLHLNTHRGELEVGTDGQIWGHACAENAFAVAAVNVSTAMGGSFAGGTANPIETFSSDGFRRIFYYHDGTPVTPGNFLSTGGTLRRKPDIAAADGVSTSTPGFNPFFGTSAAAPHAAAIAGLILSADPGLTNSEIRDILADSSLDIEGVDFDRDSGYGIMDALAAVSQSGLDVPAISLIGFLITVLTLPGILKFRSIFNNK